MADDRTSPATEARRIEHARTFETRVANRGVRAVRATGEHATTLAIDWPGCPEPNKYLARLGRSSTLLACGFVKSSIDDGTQASSIGIEVDPNAFGVELGDIRADTSRISIATTDAEV